MKSFLPIVLALALGTSAKAITLYPDAIVAADGVSLSELVLDGWSVVHNTGYGSSAITQTDISSWASAAGAGGYVFVGGIDQAGNVILGASGLASEVLSQTFSNTSATLYSSSNMYWYNRDVVSGGVGGFGFAPTQTIGLSQADTFNVADIERLSWHLNYNGGGWRLGSLTNLNFNNTYNRIVLVGQASVPDGGATIALLGGAFVALAAVRRRKR